MRASSSAHRGATSSARSQRQCAHLRRDRDQTDEALQDANQAIIVATTNQCPEVRSRNSGTPERTCCCNLGRDQEAMEELNAVANVEMAPALRSRFLHLKALLLDEQHGPQALEHLLESYHQDRLRGDHAGVAVSLMAIAHSFRE